MYFKTSFILKLTDNLNASIDFRMTVVKKERVLRVVLNFALTLWLSSHVVIIAWFKNVVILLLVIWHVASLGHLDEFEGTLKKRLRIRVYQHFWMIINNYYIDYNIL